MSKVGRRCATSARFGHSGIWFIILSFFPTLKTKIPRLWKPDESFYTLSFGR